MSTSNVKLRPRHIISELHGTVTDYELCYATNYYIWMISFYVSNLFARSIELVIFHSNKAIFAAIVLQIKKNKKLLLQTFIHYNESNPNHSVVDPFRQNIGTKQLRELRSVGGQLWNRESYLSGTQTTLEDKMYTDRNRHQRVYTLN